MSSDGSADMMLQAARDALWACAWASLPVLVPILIVGVIVGVLQAATSINEATLSFVPKLIVTGVVLAVFGWAITSTLVTFTHAMIGRIALVVR